MYTQMRGVDEIKVNFDGPIGAGVPDEVRDSQQLYDVYSQLSRQVATESPWCVVHGDSHIGNVFLHADGHPSFVDWQLVQRGPWYLDVGYHLSSCLTIEDRRAHERDLVAPLPRAARGRRCRRAVDRRGVARRPPRAWCTASTSGRSP